MAVHHRVLEWLRTADAPLPRFVRSGRRAVARTTARHRHGTITAHMEAVVAEANSEVVGESMPARPRPRRAGRPGGRG